VRSGLPVLNACPNAFNIAVLASQNFMKICIYQLSYGFLPGVKAFFSFFKKFFLKPQDEAFKISQGYSLVAN